MQYITYVALFPKPYAKKIILKFVLIIFAIKIPISEKSQKKECELYCRILSSSTVNFENSKIDISKYWLIRNKIGTDWIQRISPIQDI